MKRGPKPKNRKANCHPDKSAIGLAKEDINTLKRMIEYVKEGKKK